jgi:hypothetical protein
VRRQTIRQHLRRTLKAVFVKSKLTETKTMQAKTLHMLMEIQRTPLALRTSIAAARRRILRQRLQSLQEATLALRILRLCVVARHLRTDSPAKEPRRLRWLPAQMRKQALARRSMLH